MNIAIVGATGMVGQKFLDLLRERDFPVGSVRLFASLRNKGKSILFNSQAISLETLSDTTHLKNIDIAFFSAGEDVSKKWAFRFAQAGVFVIDNSSAFRMAEGIPLMVPEVNGINSHFPSEAKRTEKPKQVQKGGVIANPNCSTIQLVMVLSPLSQKFGLSEVHVSTYQAISGAGQSALEQLKQESQALLRRFGEHATRAGNIDATPVSARDRCVREDTACALALSADSKVVAFNCIPQIGSINSAGFSTEEWKLMQETKKILNLPHLKVTATAVRVPTFNGHGEAVLLTLKRSVGQKELKAVLSSQKGLKVLEGEDLPHPRFVDEKDDIYVGRIRPVPQPVREGEQKPDLSKEWMMWITGDNLKKGAALNGLQIAETLIQQKLVQ